MLHKEGFNIILSAFVIVSLLIISIDYFEVKFALTIKVFLIVMLILILQFFRNPILPLHLDVGSASGDFLFELALENNNWNVSRCILWSWVKLFSNR